MILMIDWGNTQLKFVQCDSLTKQGLTDGQFSCVDNLEVFEQQTKREFELVLVSSVRSEQENELLLSLLNKKSQQVFFAKTSLQACGISCAYAEPSRLGIDRWLGILAAQELSHSVGLVSIGTAITLDIVAANKHLGGHILPGRQLMFDSLFSTGQVRPDSNEASEQFYQLGTSTSECVNFAADASIHAYLCNMMQAMQKQHQVNCWVFTGGGGEYWGQLLEQSGQNILHRPFIVFEGLLKLYLEQAN